MGETHVQSRGVARAHLALKNDLAVAQCDGRGRNRCLQ